eukprot:scaffold278_cov195-Amphora_coffeaeformis.AAC.3
MRAIVIARFELSHAQKIDARHRSFMKSRGKSEGRGMCSTKNEERAAIPYRHPHSRTSSGCVRSMDPSSRSAREGIGVKGNIPLCSACEPFRRKISQGSDVCERIS